MAFSEFVVLVVNWATPVADKFVLLIRTFVRTDINLMCGCFNYSKVMVRATVTKTNPQII